jgi:hypothetical protein
MQLGSPKASPITDVTWAVFKRYIDRSAELEMVVSPSLLPK